MYVCTRAKLENPVCDGGPGILCKNDVDLEHCLGQKINENVIKRA